MKLFAFYYRGYGDYSLFVMADNVMQAIAAIESHEDFRSLDHYDLKVFDALKVATHVND